MSFNKSSVKDAILEFKDIEKFAIETAKKSIEESMAPKIEQVIIDSIKELEAKLDETQSVTDSVTNVVEEAVKIDITPSDEVVISVDGKETLTVGGDGTTDSLENSNTETEMNNTPQEEEMFEIEGLSEDGETAAAAPAALMAAEPIAEPGVDASPAEQEILKKLDALLAATPGAAADGGEGQVQVVDDDGTDPNAMPPAAGAAPAAPGVPPVNEDDIMFEFQDDISSLFEDDDTLFEDSGEINLDELEGIDEIEIVDEEDVKEGEEIVDEMKGMSNAVRRSARNREDFKDDKLSHADNSALNETSNKIKAQ